MTKTKKTIPNHAVFNEALIQAQQLFEQGLALHQQGQLAQAQALYKQAINIQPKHCDAIHMSGVIACQQGNYQLGYELISKTIRINPNTATAHNNLGLALQELKRPGAAVISYERAIAIMPDYSEAYNHRGNALNELNQLDAALASYDRALAINPYYAEAYYNRGAVLQKLNRFHDALESYDKAFLINPDLEFLYGMRLHEKMRICDWNGVDTQLMELENKIFRGEKVIPPFPLLGIKDSPALQRKSAEIFARNHYMINNSPSLRPGHGNFKKKKITVGYFSADFGEHPTSYLTAGLYEMHDRSRFEIIAFSFCPHSNSEIRKRLMSSFDKFVDVHNKSDWDVAKISRQLSIDIAIDLGGYTQNSRPGIFAHRAAPIQVSYLGYLGTMGAEYMDYLIADATILPQEYQKYYSEKIIYLPSYQANDSKRPITNKTFSREELGLPMDGFAFCCFNNNYKITPAIFEIWMRILKAVDQSALCLYAENEWAMANLAREAKTRGVSQNRIIFGKRLDRPEYLARYRSFDLFLDTLPYNAGTTASDALWAGLPVLTCIGESFASRVAASLLNAIRLPELIAPTLADYERLAIQLATHPTKLAEIRRQLAANRLTTPLFDTELFTKHLEAAYIQIHARYHANLPPDNIYIQP